MKRLLATTMIILLLTGCNNSETKEAESPPLAPPKSIEETASLDIPIIDLSDYNALDQKYFYPIFGSEMFVKSWDYGEEINPDSFAKFFGTNDTNDIFCSVVSDGEVSAPAEKVEAYAQNFFDVSIEP